MVLCSGLAALPMAGSVRAAVPVVTISPTRARIQVIAASLSDTIDALSRAASFKVTYEGARPNAMLFNTEIDTPSVALTLFRLLEGQGLNYGAALDVSGRKVNSLLILGVVPKAGGTPAPGLSGARPQPFATPGSRNDLPPVDDDPQEPVPPETPAPEPSAAPSSSPTETRPVSVSPFGPRLPFGGPFGPRPTPTTSPLPR